VENSFGQLGLPTCLNWRQLNGKVGGVGAAEGPENPLARHKNS